MSESGKIGGIKMANTRGLKRKKAIFDPRGQNPSRNGSKRRTDFNRQIFPTGIARRFPDLLGIREIVKTCVFIADAVSGIPRRLYTLGTRLKDLKKIAKRWYGKVKAVFFFLQPVPRWIQIDYSLRVENLYEL